MKNGFVVVAIAAFTLFGCTGSDSVQVGFKTTMKINSVFDAGRIAKGEVITAKFDVENTGESPLVLSDVKGSCSCTVASFSQDPIAPGETGFIEAKVNTENFPIGAASRSITVLSNTTPASTSVAVKATIIK